MGPGGLWWSNVLNLALLPQRLRPDTRLEHQDPVSHMALKMEKKRKKREMIRKISLCIYMTIIDQRVGKGNSYIPLVQV